VFQKNLNLFGIIIILRKKERIKAIQTKTGNWGKTNKHFHREYNKKSFKHQLLKK
jgi:hypothetical protein